MHQPAAQGYAPADPKARAAPLRAAAVCVGRRAKLAGIEGVTGIHKRPTKERVPLGEMGLAGDAVVDLEHHGGRDQAVYAFGSLDIAYWEDELGAKLAPGFMGENLVIENLDTHNVYVGDRFVLPDAILEATLPRIPCATFAAQMGDRRWGRRFLASGHLGVYLKVVRAGSLGAGDPIELAPAGAGSRRILDLV